MRLEKYYTACDSAESLRAEYGPFKTSAEAEKHARRLRFEYICIYTHVLGEADAIVDVKERVYRIAPDVEFIRAVRTSRKTAYPVLTDRVSGCPIAKAVQDRTTPNVTPLSEDEKKFFEKYEQQLMEGSSDV
jgi:hypothetical protein